MPTPKAGESEGDFVARCIPIVLEDGTAEDEKQAAAVCYSMFKEGSMEEVSKTVDGESYPASDFLVVEDEEAPSTWHLQVKRKGTPDHNLMGAAWAALHGGYRGNKYEGAGKGEALSKLKALYKSEDMPMPMGEMEAGTAAEKIRALYKLAQELMDMVEPDEQDETTMEVAERAPALELTEYEGDLSEFGESLPADKGRRAPVYVDFAIIKPGAGNKRDRRYYRKEVLERDAHVFEGNDVFVTDHKEAERSERTKAGKVVKCPIRFTEIGEPVGRILLYDPDQAEKARNRNDAGELGTLECSIFASGTAKDGVIDGERYSIVEAITEGKFVELVSKAGAGGRALELVECEGGSMDEKEKVAVVEEAQPQEQPKPVEIQEAEPVTLLESDKVRELLKTAKLPEAAKSKLAEREYKTEAELNEAIEHESAYLAEIMESGKPFAQTVQAPVEKPLVEVDKSIDTANKRWGF